MMFKFIFMVHLNHKNIRISRTILVSIVYKVLLKLFKLSLP